MPDSAIRTVISLGAGYVGGPTMAVMAEKNPDIDFYVTDKNEARIRAWNSDELPVFEPGLNEIVQKIRDKNLFFRLIDSDLLAKADIIFVCVNTPTKGYGHGKGLAADLQYWELAIRDIKKFAKPGTIIVEKSTVPVKTAEAISVILNSDSTSKRFPVISNPEFLAEGTAIEDLRHPDRVLIGHEENPEGEQAARLVKSLYAAWVPEEKILLTNVWSSELSKLTANAFLAQRVSSINSISALCEQTNAEVQEIANAIGADSRIGSKFLQAGIGFGGSCFKKDILNLVYLCRKFGLPEVADYWQSVVRMNEFQMERFVEQVIDALFNTVSGKKIAVLGFAFKPDTDDIRESPAIYICKKLLEEKARLYIHDPKALENAKEALAGIDENVVYTRSVDEAVSEAHAILVITHWQEYKQLDFRRLHESMLKPAFLFDGRIIADAKELYKIGFNVFQIGTTPLVHY